MSARRRVAFIAIGLAIGMMTVACSSSAPGTKATETSGGGTESPTASAAPPLQGDWDTGVYPSSQVRAAITAAGYTNADADEVLGGGKRFEFNLVFYEQSGVPVVGATGWDPKSSQPPDGDHGPYRFLPNDRIAITCDVCDLDTQYMLFSYELSENTLTLHFIRSVDPERTAKELHDDAPFLIAWTAAPLSKAG